MVQRNTVSGGGVRARTRPVLSGLGAPTATASQAITNDTGDAAQGSQTFTPSGGCRSWARGALLGLGMAGALMAGSGRSAQAGCSLSLDGATYTCTGGDFSEGIVVPDGVTLLEFNDLKLNAAIKPADGVSGINFTGQGNVTINSQLDFRDIDAIDSDEGVVPIETTGENAHGINAVSTGGTVTVTNVSDITTGGKNAHGINVDASGDAKVTQTHNIRTTGTGANGINVVSANGGVTVDLITGDINAAGAAIRVKSKTGAEITLRGSSSVHSRNKGVWFDDDGGGQDNKLTIGKNLELGGRMAIKGEGGNEKIFNSGTITGNVDLGDGANAFFNYAGAVFSSRETVFLGAGNLFTNAGDWSPFGTNRVGKTTLTGDLVQLDSGRLIIDIDGAGKSPTDGLFEAGAFADLIEVSGFADLANSTIVLQVVSLPDPTIKGSVVILEITGGGPDSVLTADAEGLRLLASPALSARLKDVEVGSKKVMLEIVGVDFTGKHNGLNVNKNQKAVSQHIHDSHGAGDGSLSPLHRGLANTIGHEAYRHALDQLHPKIYADTQMAALYASLDFSNNLLSCRVNGTTTASINREGQCLWVGAKARFLDSARTHENIGFDETAGLFAAGAQVALDAVWRLGFGVGYQKSSLNTDTGAKSDSDQVQGAIALKYNPGALLLAGVVSGGRGWYDTTRPMAFGGFAAAPESDHEIDVLAGRLHASYVYGSPNFYVKPIIDAAVTRLDLDGVTETNGNGAGLVVQGDDHTVFSVSPALELGTQWWLGNGTLVRPFVRAGATWFSDDNVTVSASFAGTPDGVDPFTIRAEMDQVQADVAAGVEMINAEGSGLRFYYDGHFGDTVEIHSVGLKGSAAF